MKPVRVSFTDEAKAVYEYVSQMSLTSRQEKIMFTALQRKLEYLKLNPFIGQPVVKRLIPREYVKKYHV